MTTGHGDNCITSPAQSFHFDCRIGLHNLWCRCLRIFQMFFYYQSCRYITLKQTTDDHNKQVHTLFGQSWLTDECHTDSYSTRCTLAKKSWKDQENTSTLSWGCSINIQAKLPPTEYLYDSLLRSDCCNPWSCSAYIPRQCLNCKSVASSETGNVYQCLFCVQHYHVIS